MFRFQLLWLFFLKPDTRHLKPPQKLAIFRANPAAGGPIYKVAPEMQIERSGGKRSTSAGGLYALYDIDCEGDKVIHPQDGTV